MGSILGLGRSPGEGNDYPLQYSGPENSMDCIVHGVAKSQTPLSNFHFHSILWYICIYVCVYVYIYIHIYTICMYTVAQSQTLLKWFSTHSCTWLHFHLSLSCIGEGNGNPLQCSCLEIPGMREPGGLLSVGSHRVGYDWSDLAAAAAACTCIYTYMVYYDNYYDKYQNCKTHIFYLVHN